jgi:hypothetical protein
MPETFLVKNGRPVGAIMRDTRSDSPLLRRAEEQIQQAARQVCQQNLPVVNYIELQESLRAKNAIAIGTEGYMRQIFGLGSEGARDLGSEGFWIFPTSAASATVTVVTGCTEQAVCRGVEYLIAHLLTKRGQDLFVPPVRVKEAPPRMPNDQ